MPLPTRKKGEEKKAFISRCMGNSQVKKDFPDQKQRTAVCFSRASREQPEFTQSELEALGTALPIGTRGKPLMINLTKRKKFKRKKDRFRKVGDDEVGSSVTGEEEKIKKKKKDKKKKVSNNPSY